METRYTLMFSYVLNNVVGYVIAPEGKEDIPASERGNAWRCIMMPLSTEVAYDKDLPHDDLKTVAKEISKFIAGKDGELVSELYRRESCWGKKN